MNIDKLKIIEETLEENLLEEIINKQPILNQLDLYDVTHLKNRIISTEDDEQKELETYVSLRNIMHTEINFEEFYVHQIFDAKDKTASMQTFLEGTISEQVDLITNYDQIIGFMRYFISEIPPEYNIERILNKFDSIKEVKDYFLEFNNKKQFLPVNNKILANKYFKENNSKLTYFPIACSVIKTIGLTANFLETITLK